MLYALVNGKPMRSTNPMAPQVATCPACGKTVALCKWRRDDPPTWEHLSHRDAACCVDGPQTVLLDVRQLLAADVLPMQLPPSLAYRIERLIERIDRAVDLCEG